MCPTGGGVDYDSGPYTVTFPAGRTSAPFTVPINDDNTLESAETFNVTIIHSSLPDRVTVVDPREAAVIIGNDDGKQHYRSKLGISVIISTAYHPQCCSKQFL